MFGFMRKKNEEKKCIEGITTKTSELPSTIDELAHFMLKNSDEKDIIAEKLKIYKFLEELLKITCSHRSEYSYSFTYVNKYGFDTDIIIFSDEPNNTSITLSVLADKFAILDNSPTKICRMLKLRQYFSPSDNSLVEEIGSIIEDCFVKHPIYDCDKRDYLAKSLKGNTKYVEMLNCLNSITDDYYNTYVNFRLEHANLFMQSENSKVSDKNSNAIE